MKIALTDERKNKLKALFKSTKAQIRGVDFALALLIFVIAFSQVIIVLSNLLIPSLVQMETYSQEQELNKLYSTIFYSEGNPANWGTIATTGLEDLELGLMGSNLELDYILNTEPPPPALFTNIQECLCHVVHIMVQPGVKEMADCCIFIKNKVKKSRTAIRKTIPVFIKSPTSI